MNAFRKSNRGIDSLIGASIQCFLRILLPFTVSCILSALWIAGGYSIFGHDSGFRIDALSHWKSLLYSWNQGINYGTDWSITKGFLVPQLPETLFTVSFGSLRIAEYFIFVFWLLVPFLSAKVVFQRWFDGKGIAIGLVAPVLYMLNFYILQGWFIAERAKFSLYAALPLGIFLVYRVLVEQQSIIRNALYFGFLYFVLNGGGSPPLYGATLVAIGLAFVYFGFLRVLESGRGQVFYIFKAIVAFMVSFMLFNAYWLLPMVGLAIGSYGTSLGAFGGVDGLISWERVVSANASVTNLLRLQGGPDWYGNGAGNAYSGPFLTNPVLIAASYVPFLLILTGLLTGVFRNASRKHRIVLGYMFLLLLVGLFFTAGTHPPFGFIYEVLMRKLPGFAIFRSSYYKFGPMVWLSIIVLSVYTLQYLLDTFIRNRVIRSVAGYICALAIIAYHYPFFGTSIFRIQEDFSTRLKIPDYIHAAGRRLSADTDESARILLLPELNDGYYSSRLDTYDWGFFSMDLLPRLLSGRTFVANDVYANPMIAALYDALYLGDIDGFNRLNELAGITHILWRGDTKANPKAEGIRSAKIARSALERIERTTVFKEGEWELYALASRHTVFGGVIPYTSYVLADDVKDIPSLRAAGLVASDTAILTRPPPLSADLPRRGLVYQAECIACGRDTLENQLARMGMPDIPHTPGSFLFIESRRRQKSRLQITDSLSSVQRIDTFLARMTDYVMQIRLADTTKNTKHPYKLNIAASVSDYVSDLENLTVELARLQEPARNDYAIRLALYIALHRRSMPGSIPQDDWKTISAAWERVNTLIRPLIWASDAKAHRYRVPIGEQGEYEIYVRNKKPDSAILLDGKLRFNGDTVRLDSGHYQISIADADATKSAAPTIYLMKRDVIPLNERPQVKAERLDPTATLVKVNTSVAPYILRYNQQFSKGWMAYSVSFGINRIFGYPLPNIVSIPPENHLMIDGYANGWVLAKGGGTHIVLFYLPQAFTYVGLFVTVASISGLFIYSLYHLKHKS